MPVDMTHPVRLSVVMAIHDHDCLDKHLLALADQTVPRSEYEVIYVDGEHAIDSESVIRQTLQLLGTDLRVRYFRVPKGGRAASWNRGIRAASGELLLLLADDFLATRCLVEEHMKAHQRVPQLEAAALGPALFPPELEISSFMRWLEDSGHLFGVSFSKANGKIPADFFYGANVSVKKDFLCRAGLFNEAFPYHACEDYELGKRLIAQGMQVIFVPQALAYHFHTITLRGRQTMMRQAGESMVIFETIHPGVWPWQQDCHLHPIFWRVAAGWALLKFKIFRRHRDLESHYAHTLKTAFVEGYRTAKTGTVSLSLPTRDRIE